MEERSYQFLKRLVDTPGPSGYEQQVQKVFREELADIADQIQTDIMGNVTAILNPGSAVRVMLVGHADEIGFQVRYIAEDGSIYFGQIGGHDAVVAVGQRVQIHTSKGPIPGVLGRKAVHLLEAGERDKVPKTDDLWIDIGAASKSEVEELVQIGDCITYAQQLQLLHGDRATARSFDNKMGCFLVAEALRILKNKPLRCSVYGVSSVQEEVGLRGARTASFEIDPLVGIATDVCHAMDYPGADKKKVGDIKLGKGPTIVRGANINPKVFSLMVETARSLDIPYQVEAAPGGTGTDANAMQISRAGMATGLIGVPLRYMHTPNEIMSLQDIVHGAQLMAGFVERITPEIDWTP